jgi:hypothetical protein
MVVSWDIEMALKPRRLQSVTEKTCKYQNEEKASKDQRLPKLPQKGKKETNELLTSKTIAQPENDLGS